jgi:tetratricopeptide (TPR) repeat protein
MKPEVLQRNLKGASDSLLERKVKGEIDDRGFRDYMRTYANDLLNKVPIKDVPPKEAWRYAEVFLTAERWEDAKGLLEIAVKNAPDEDRRINDSLRLARALAMLGEVDQAIATARTTYNAAPKDSAPVLTAVLLEIVPAGEGKDKDPELSKLLEDAIPIHQKTLVDPNTEPGRAFLAARPVHVRNAYDKVVELLVNAGKAEEAREAAKRGEKVLGEMGRI